MRRLPQRQGAVARRGRALAKRRGFGAGRHRALPDSGRVVAARNTRLPGGKAKLPVARAPTARAEEAMPVATGGGRLKLLTPVKPSCPKVATSFAFWPGATLVMRRSSPVVALPTETVLAWLATDPCPSATAPIALACPPPANDATPSAVASPPPAWALWPTAVAF